MAVEKHGINRWFPHEHPPFTGDFPLLPVITRRVSTFFQATFKSKRHMLMTYTCARSPVKKSQTFCPRINRQFRRLTDFFVRYKRVWMGYILMGYEWNMHGIWKEHSLDITIPLQWDTLPSLSASTGVGNAGTPKSRVEGWKRPASQNCTWGNFCHVWRPERYRDIMPGLFTLWWFNSLLWKPWPMNIGDLATKHSDMYIYI